MPLVISTTNSPGLILYAIVDRVDASSQLLVPGQRWDTDTEGWSDPEDMSESHWKNPIDEYESGFYSATIEGIDPDAENLRIIIINDDTEVTIGLGYTLRLAEASPQFIIDLDVTEDRD